MALKRWDWHEYGKGFLPQDLSREDRDEHGLTQMKKRGRACLLQVKITQIERIMGGGKCVDSTKETVLLR